MVKNAPSKEVFLLVEKYMLDVPRSEYLVRELLLAKTESDSNMEQIRSRIEKRLCEFLSGLDRKLSFFQIWTNVVTLGDNTFKPLFVATLKDPNQAERHVAAAKALVRLGYRDECEVLLRDIVLSAGPYKPAEGVNQRRTYENKKARWVRLGAFNQLAVLLAGSGDAEFKQQILEKLYCNGRGWYAIEALNMLHKVGCEEVGELWRQLPQWQLTGSTHKFYQTWHSNNHSRQDLINWINKNVQQPDNPISIQSVIDAPRYSPESYTWHWNSDDMVTEYLFAMFALAHSQQGGFTDGDNWLLMNFNQFLKEIVPGGDSEFSLTSLSKEAASSDIHRIVVNRRMYEYQITYDHTEWRRTALEIRAAVDILNTIAIRQRLKKRFFVYESGMGTSMRLVLFVSPSVAKKLMDKFSITPLNNGLEFLGVKTKD